MYRHSSRIRAVVSGAVAAAAFFAVTPLEGQQPPASDSVRAEMRRLAAMVDSLRAEVDRLKAEGRSSEADDALTALRAAAAAAARSGAAEPRAQEPADQEFVGRQRSLQALNPEISLTGDVFAQVRKDGAGSENFFAREFEISIISNLDPFSRAKVFLSRHVPGGEITPFAEDGHDHDHAEEHGDGFSVEEGYVEWVSLPGGVGLKVGRFFQQLGQLNRWHAHAYPFQSRSLPSLAFIGEEPLAQTGVSLQWLAPIGGGAGTYTATFEATRSENAALFGESSRPSFLANVNAFWQLSPATDLDLSASWVGGRYQDEDHRFDRNLYAAEMSFTWRPPARARYRGLNVRAGTMVLDGLLSHEGEVLSTSAKGLWTMAEARVGQSWLLGGRFDWAENPEEPDETAWLLSPTLTWWQSEFVRLRAEYDLLGQGDVRDGRFMIQATFSMGPHKHEIY